jgi:hypothetical protein
MSCHRFVSGIEENMAALDLIRFEDSQKSERDKILGDCPFLLLFQKCGKVNFT